MDLKGKNESNTTKVWNFNTPLTSMDSSTREKINKESSDLNNTLDQKNLIDMYRTFHPKAADIHSSQVHTEHSPG